jgi:hypothetical protein
MKPLPPVFAVITAVWLGARAVAEPAAPSIGPSVDHLELGVFCAMQAMGQAPAPGTLSGWLHVPDHDVRFDWPDRQTVPAAIGLAFGTRVQMTPGITIPFGEMRVYRPGSLDPETWGTNFTDLGETLAFFRFDQDDELIPGIWRFEGWDGETRLFMVEFEVVPAKTLRDIATACGATS